MPIYVWKCIKCNERVEELRKVGDFDPPIREECSQDDGPCELERQVTAANFRIDPAAG